MKKLLCTSLIICLGQLLVAQTTSDIVKAAFDNFIQIPEESVYLHLNKSVLLQGEDLGFAAYVFNHKEQKPFEVVKNLYCQLLDEKGNIIKEKLLLLEQGKVFHTFALDSLTPPGNYTIKAFTNWMKNFKSPHFFEAPILILEENGKQQTISRNTATSINIFPEGGYLVKDVSSTVTFSIDESMRGDSNYAELFVNEKQLGNVSLDRQGIGRFTLDPKQVNSYKIKLEKSSVFLTLNLPKIRNTGIVLSVNQHGEKVNIELRTNEETLNSKKDNELILLVNGSQKLNIYNILLRNLKEIISLDLSEFNSGMNQITLMTTDKQVISKRLIFNYNDFEIIKSSQVNLSRVLDTITSQIAFNDIKEAALSVSVLPIETISLDKAQSISASFKLYPYLYDTVKNPLYYLSDVNERKKYEMDNLLLCLGWEMYNWDFIFQEEKFFKNEFENGITAIANINDSKSKDFSVLFNRNSKTTLISLEKDDNSFLLESFFPIEGENLRISEISKKGVAKNTGMYVRFFPSQIPSLRNSRNPKPINISKSSDGMLVNPLIKRAIKLDTVQLKTETAKEKRDRILVSKARGQMDIFSDWDREREVDIFQYLRRFNIIKKGNYLISARQPNILQPQELRILLDDFAYMDANILQGFDMSVVDYIEIDLNGVMRNQVMGRGGVVVIKTDQAFNIPFKQKKMFSSFEIPLTFAVPVDFFRPTYYSYDDDSFKKLGVIDWHSNVYVIDGKASFKIPYLGLEKMLLHIQGWTPDGKLIDEIIEVTVQ